MKRLWTVKGLNSRRRRFELTVSAENYDDAVRRAHEMARNIMSIESVVLKSTPKDFWTYQAASETPDFDSVPKTVFKGTRDDWESLSPGMRREIMRSAKKNPKRKASPAQIAARKRFAAMAKAGKFRKRTKRNPKSNVSDMITAYMTTRYYENAKRWPKTLNIPLETYLKVNRKDVERNYKNGLKDILDFSTDYFSKVTKNPVKAGARRSPPKRNPAEKFVIRAQRPVKSGYLYYYLRGDQFVKDAKHADKYAKAAGEKHMRAILPKLPRAIASITLVKA